MKIIRRTIYPALYLIFGYGLLLGTCRPFLTETADMTPFYTTGDFLSEMLQRPAGALFYVASLLQSCMARPVLGASLLLFLLTCLAYAVKFTLRLPGRYEALCWLPPLALLANFTQIGYSLYTLKTPAVAFTPVVGLLAALLLTRLLQLTAHRQRVVGKSLALAFICVMSFMCFHLLGTYAMIAALLFVISTARQMKTERPYRLLQICIAIVSFLTIPMICYQQGWYHVRQADLYLQGLPDFMWGSDNAHLSTPIRTAVVLLACYALLPLREPAGKGLRRITEMGGVLLLVAGMALTYHKTFRDRNFFAILEMRQSLEKGDAERVLQLSMQCADEPTRAQVMLTRVALWQLGLASDKLFTYPDGSAPYNAPIDNQYLRLMAGRTIYYYLGKINYAYRWCMEDMVEYGRRPSYLACMAKCALLNGETALAEKYLGQLRHTFFYTGLADRYTQLLASHQHDKEMKALLPLLRYNDMLDGDGGLVELYCLQSMAYSQGGSREMVDMSLMCNLITKNINGFWPRFFQLLPTWKGHIPVHYQEAALLFSRLQGKPDISRLPINTDIRQSFERLIQASAQNGDNQSNAVTLRPEFGGTYWYYYFFVNGLKTS